MTNNQSTKDAVIIDEWRKMNTDSVGRPELLKINEALIRKFGTGGAQSPASMARLLADHGARLRHPEVLEADMFWREQRMDLLFAPGEINFTTMARSLESITKLDDLYRQFVAEGDRAGAQQLKEFARGWKTELKRPPLAPLAGEVAEWLTIWLLTPQMLAEWLDLRLKSPDFQARFGSQL